MTDRLDGALRDARRAVSSPAAGIRGATRELVLAAGGLILLGRFVDGPLAWLVGAAVFAAVALGSLQVLGETETRATAAGVPVESLLLPGAAAFAGFAAVHLVPVGLLLVPAMALAAWFLARTVRSEARILAASGVPSSADRTNVLVEALVIGFLGFTGIAGLVPGGLPEPGAGVDTALSGQALAILAVADAALAFLLGYRAGALRSSNLRDVAWLGVTSALVIAIAAAALRAMEIPRLLGPALLVLVFFLWDAVHSSAPTRRRDARRIWEAGLLLVLGVVVVAWSLRLRG